MNKWRYHVLTLLWAMIIALLTLSPGRSMPETPFWEIPYFDKIVHAGIFGLLSFLMVRGLIKQYAGQKLKFAFAVSFLLTFSYSVIIEFTQKLVPGRSFEFGDLIANASGTLLGLTACYFLLKLVSNKP